jgi:ribosomal protein S14
MVSTILALTLFKIMRNIRKTYLEMRCPQCERSLAAVIMDEELKGIYKKYEMDPFRTNGHTARIRLKSTRKVKYEIRNRCRYCGHEWFTTRSEKA